MSATSIKARIFKSFRVDHEQRKKRKKLYSISEDKKNQTKIDWNETSMTKPKFLGNKLFFNFRWRKLENYRLDSFFQTWMLAGRYPGILNDAVVGSEAKRLFDDAQKMLDQIIKDKSLQANGVFGFYAATRTEADDVKLSRREGEEPFTTFHFLRQQNKKLKNSLTFAWQILLLPLILPPGLYGNVCCDSRIRN